MPPIDQLSQQPRQIQDLDLSPDTKTTAAVDDLINKLFQIRPGTDKPRSALLRQFQKHRADAIPELIRLVETPQYWWEESRGEGWTPILATRLLGFLKATEAADVLVNIVAKSEWDAAIRDAAILSLITLGRSTLPAVRTFFRYGRQDEGRVALAEVLSRIGQDDPESFDLLAGLWERVDWPQYKRLVAVALGALGDKRAIPLLRARAEDRQADVFGRDYVAWAVATLEGESPPPTTKLGRLGRNRPKLPQLYRPRLIVNEQDCYDLPDFTVWNEMLCPDCGAQLVRHMNGTWSHPPGHSERAIQPGRSQAATRPPRPPKKRRRKRKKRKR